MSNTAYRAPTRGYEYTVAYSDMGGVNLSGERRKDKRRFSMLQNLYRDYEGSGALESIPGFRRILALGSRINGIFSQRSSEGKDYLIVHSGTSLFRISVNEIGNNQIPSPIATLQNRKTRAFSSGADLYILDGEKIYVVDEYGRFGILGDESFPAYIPTTYVNGEGYQAMNLLSENFRESFRIGDAREITHASDGIRYFVTDEAMQHCSIVGISESAEGDVILPAFTEIGGKKYRVTEIADAAFIGNTSVRTLHIADGILRVCRSAFLDCTSLEKIYMPPSLTEIDDGAFSGCSALREMTLGTGIKRIGAAAFSGCDLDTVYYDLSAEEISKIDGHENLPHAEYSVRRKSYSVMIAIPIYTPASDIISVTLDGEECEFDALYSKEDICTKIILKGKGRGCFDGAKVEILGVINEEFVKLSSSHMGLISPEESIDGREAVFGCTVAESFDGRIFLSGNPRLPNTVIYTERDDGGRNCPAYFGIYSYFNDGDGRIPVISLLGVGTSLAVFKGADDGCGSIFYHTPRETGNPVLPKIYPTSYVHKRISAIGDSISFLDDPVFLSKNGLCALDKQVISSDKSVSCRSGNVNEGLLSENLSEASLAVWRGYLAILCNGRIYLADSRDKFRSPTGDTEYEWYLLTDIGTHSSDSVVYNYSSKSSGEGYLVSELMDKPVPDEAEIKYESGIHGTVSYVIEDGKKYEVYPTAQYKGGIFHPATELLSIGETLLFFGCENGDVCIFNSDKRGVAPPHLSRREDFDPGEYKRVYGNTLHPYYYDFATHAPKYLIRTPIDDGGIPYFEKNSVKGSMILKCRIGGTGGGLLVEVGTERSGYKEAEFIPNAVIDFSELDFSAMAFTGYGDLTIPINERERGWIEKQISLSVSDYMTPIAFHSLCYRFKIKGKIKSER